MSDASLYIPKQARVDIDTRPFILNGHPKNVYTAVFAQDGGRSIDLETFTLLSKIAATGKWTSYTDETAIDGTAFPSGIYLGPTITSAAIISGDIEIIPTVIADATFDVTRLIIENSKTMDTIIAIGTVNAITVRDYLIGLQLIPSSTVNRSGFEN